MHPDMDIVSAYPSVFEKLLQGPGYWQIVGPAGKTHAMVAMVEQMTLDQAVDELDKLNDRVDLLRDHVNALHSAGNDEYEDGTVIRFNKPMAIRGIERKLVYVAIKKADAWFVTGESGPNEVDWNTLVLWAGPDNIADREIVKEWASR